MWAYIDDSSHGGPAAWKVADEELSIGPYSTGPRMHLRIYECFVPDQPSARERLGFGTWSIGAVHLEHWMFPGMHIVHGWHEAQDFVEDCFAGQTGVNQIWRQDIGNAGWYQGHWFDGEATFIELL